jgi:putative CocE/NonD family hydrolase
MLALAIPESRSARSPVSCRTIVLLCGTLLSAGSSAVRAQTFQLTTSDLADSAALTRSMPRLAAEVLATYRDTARASYLDNLVRLQILTGKYREAAATLVELRASRETGTPAARARDVQYQVFVRAKVLARSSGRSFPDAFAESFRETFGRLDDATAAFAARSFLVTARTAASDLRWATPDQTGKTTVSLADALTLLHVYAAVESYRGFAGLPAALMAQDDARRYAAEMNVAVRTADGATVCAIVVRPRAARGTLPALLQFTIYADSVSSLRDALLAAAHGYVGVTGFTRGKACSPDRTVPYVHDGADAAALIEWIAAQSWSDGRVGMYGGSYSGFTAWAAAKHMPQALRAIMVGAPVAPGIDVPMEGGVFWNFVYPWPFYTTNNRWLDSATYNDNGRWNGLYRRWYTSGRPYRDLEAIDGTPNPGFAAWLAHPTVDNYWQATIPQGAEYARITIPVLQTAGYFYGGPGGAVYYFLEHYRHNPHANHYLVIGPYDHIQAQRGVVTLLGDTATYISGYVIDPAARIDVVADLRYQWFDYVLRGGPRPALLRDRLNYQVMGANVWKHAPSLAAAANDRFRLYFNPARLPGGSRYTLSDRTVATHASITQTVNLADRSDVDLSTGVGLVDAAIDSSNAIVLVSEPLPDAVEVSGLMSGHLELIANKRDFDFTITPYEWTADGQYVQLPPYTSRASHVASLSERRLLTPGTLSRLDSSSGIRMMSRRLASGSRFVIVLSVVKNPRQQINYGTGKDVSNESVADAGEPLTIRWLSGSYVEFPVRR